MSRDRVRLDSLAAKPAMIFMGSIWAIGGVSVLAQVLRQPGDVDRAGLAFLAVFMLFGLVLLKRWRLRLVVYMTREGIEIKKPACLIPWRYVRDGYRLPLTGSLSPTCVIGVNGKEPFDLRFLGRPDFDSAFGEFRANLRKLENEAVD
jgi:hypothetical protein